jgi:putative transcriptional regulator
MRVQNSLQEFRLKKGITQEDLAKELGVTRQTIIAMEKGNYAPSVLLALKISKYFNINVERLFKLEE